MKNIETILAEANVELSDEQKQSINNALLENYITKAEHNKKIDKANAEKDKVQAILDETNNTLEKFKDSEATYEQTIKELNAEKDSIQADFKSKMEARDRRDAISKAVEGIEFSSNSAKKSIIADIESKNLPLEDGKLVGVGDVIEGLKESDPDAFRKSEGKNFTSPKNDNPPKKITKEEILKIKNSADRQKAIAENKELFKQGD